MALNDIGIDLGTTSIIIAMEGKGVVLNQPSIVAVDTRQNKATTHWPWWGVPPAIFPRSARSRTA